MSGGVLLGGMRVVRNLLCGGVIRFVEESSGWMSWPGSSMTFPATV